MASTGMFLHINPVGYAFKIPVVSVLISGCRLLVWLELKLHGPIFVDVDRQSKTAQYQFSYETCLIIYYYV